MRIGYDFGPWRREATDRILSRFSKCLEGFCSISLHKLCILDTNSKGTRGHACKLVKTRCTRDITKYFSQGGICWTNGRWMHPVSIQGGPKK